METLPLLHFNLVMKCCNLWLLFILSLTCFSEYCGACETEPFFCGGYPFEYPFGGSNSSCGDPLLQLQCDNNIPLLDINGSQYYILDYPNYSSSLLEGITMTIIDKNVIEKKCDSSSTNSTMQFWSTDQLQIVNVSKNIWVECQDYNLCVVELVCDTSFCYSTDENGTEKCVQPPVRFSFYSWTNLDPNIKGGLKIKWMPSSSCKDCLSNNGTCSYKANGISNPFVCQGRGKSSNKNAVLRETGSP